MYNINNPAYTLVYTSGRFNFEERRSYAIIERKFQVSISTGGDIL